MTPQYVNGTETERTKIRPVEQMPSRAAVPN
jgi:hypothetical protein